MQKLTGLLILSLVIVLGGCNNTSVEPVTTNPTHIYEEVREDFLIDAEVIGFSGDSALTVYEATPRLLSETQVTDFLASNGDPVQEWESLYDPEQNIGFRGTTTLGGSFSHTTERNSYFSGYFGYTTPPYERWGNCYIYYGQSLYEPDYQFAHLFTEPQDFAFATAQEAEVEVRHLLSILGLDDLVLHRTLYIDHEILANEVTPILRTEQWQSTDKTGFIPTYDDWSEADDGYIFEFLMGVDGNAMLYEAFQMDTAYYIGSCILVHYQSTGIIRLEITGSLWDISSPVEVIDQPILATEALAAARIKLENYRLQTDTVITTVEGKYAYFPCGDRVQLRPVWVVHANATDIFTNMDVQSSVIIDAVTGDELS